jgi:hypothetical protein
MRRAKQGHDAIVAKLAIEAQLGKLRACALDLRDAC